MSGLILEKESGISKAEVLDALKQSLEGKDLKRVLLIPPDISRANSGGGEITAMYYDLLKDSCHVDIYPALGTHEAMTREQQLEFFGDSIPAERFIVHDWRNGVEKIGVVPGEFVKEVSDGLVDTSIDVEVSSTLLHGNYDLILSIGQVVPHEVVGMANYTKNILVGCGGGDMINGSHMLGAFYGMERVMGKDFSPVRRVFDYVQENFLNNLPIVYVMTVTITPEHTPVILGLYIGNERHLFEKAVALSIKHNFIKLDRPIKTCVAYLDEKEFRSTWIGNKAIYRSRMAMADGGTLIILAPGVSHFGEDTENDRLIRKFGYAGREKILELVKVEEELQKNLSVAAHMIHGSNDGRFSVIYAVKRITQEEIESVNYTYGDFDEMVKIYDPAKLKPGYNTVNGEEIYFIPNPALGLWTV